MQRRLLILVCLWTASIGCGYRYQSELTSPAATQERSATGGAIRVAPAASCGATACHGKPYDEVRRDWTTACSVFDREDPHRQAFAVLYTERSVEIYRNLEPAAQRMAQPPEDRAYLAFLELHCVGCHATPIAAESSRPITADDYAGGVTCQSCHGPAEWWLHEHYLASFPPPGRPSRRRLIEKGFSDTTDLATRAGVCVGCHLGPQQSEGSTYEVTHDLIAAGHPRLRFELDAFLTNYPPHWDVTADQERHARLTGSRSFHFDAWRCGQEAAARALVSRLQQSLANPGSPPWPEFANFDCVDCHHAIKPAAAISRAGWPRPATEALDVAALIHAAGGPPDEALTTATARLSGLLSNWQTPQPELREAADTVQRSLDAMPRQSPAWSWPQRGKFLRQSVARIQQQPTWDRAAQLYLALAATARDEPQSSQSQALNAAAEQLRLALDDPENFRDAQSVTSYDFPDRFDPARLAAPLKRVEEALRSAGFQAAISESPREIGFVPAIPASQRGRLEADPTRLEVGP